MRSPLINVAREGSAQERRLPREIHPRERAGLHQPDPSRRIFASASVRMGAAGKQQLDDFDSVGRAAQRFPKAKTFEDFRKLYDRAVGTQRAADSRNRSCSSDSRRPRTSWTRSAT